MFEESEYLRSRGDEVSVFGRYQSGALVSESPDLFPSLVDLEGLSWRKRIAAIPRIIYNKDTGRKFGEYLDRARPDVAHGHNIYGGLTTAIIDTCREREIPFVLTLHDYKLACPSYLMLDRGRVCTKCVGGHYFHCLCSRCHKGSAIISAISTVEAYFNDWLGKYDGAAKLISPSRFLLEQMVSHGVARKKLKHLPNGVELSRFQVEFKDSGYFLYLGRLSPEKGIATLIRAATGCGMRLRIVGDGSQLAQLNSLALAQGTDVSFEGRKTGRELTSLIRDAAFCVVPSEWFENASMTVLEAMAYGKAVIGARIGGIPEQIVDQETGLLFESGNVEELAAAIRTLIADPQKRQQMGRAGRERVEKEFSLQRHCELLRGVYSETVGCSRV